MIPGETSDIGRPKIPRPEASQGNPGGFFRFWECGNWRRKLAVNQSCDEHLEVQLFPLPLKVFAKDNMTRTARKPALRCPIFGVVAQWLEHQTFNLSDEGSSPSGLTKDLIFGE